MALTSLLNNLICHFIYSHPLLGTSAASDLSHQHQPCVYYNESHTHKPVIMNLTGRFLFLASCLLLSWTSALWKAEIIVMFSTWWHTWPLCYSVILSLLALFIYLFLELVSGLPPSFVFIFMDLHNPCDRTFGTSLNLENYKYYSFSKCNLWSREFRSITFVVGEF